MTWYAIDPDDIAEDARTATLSEGAFALHTLIVYRMLKRGHLALTVPEVRALWGGRVHNIEKRWEEVRPLFETDESGCVFLQWVDDSRASTEKRLKSDAYRQRQRRVRNTEQGSQDTDCHSDVTRDVHRDITSESHRTSQDTGQTDRTEQTKKIAAPAADPWIEFTKGDAAWNAACADWALIRRQNGHKPLKALGWKHLLADWMPRGIDAFKAATAHSAASGYQGLFAPKAGSAPTAAPKATLRDLPFRDASTPYGTERRTAP